MFPAPLRRRLLRLGIWQLNNRLKQSDLIRIKDRYFSKHHTDQCRLRGQKTT